MDRNDSDVDTESESRYVFLQCAYQLHMFTLCIKDLIIVKKKNFQSLVHKNEVEKKPKKIQES